MIWCIVMMDCGYVEDIALRRVDMERRKEEKILLLTLRM